MNESLDVDCRVVYTRMEAFFDGELDQETLMIVQQHLNGCEPCVEIYDVEQKMRVTIRRCCRESAPVELRAKIQMLRATYHSGS